MRAFLSVNLSPIVIEAVAALQERLRPKLRGYRWTKPENCHLTLKFLGEIEPGTTAILDEALKPVGEFFPPFMIQLSGLGCFPPKGPPAVLWVGVTEGANELKRLENEIREGLNAFNVRFDRKPFSPHLTIGRADRGRKAAARPGPAEIRHPVAAMRVESFHLMESVLHPHGAVYTEVSRYELSQKAIEENYE